MSPPLPCLKRYRLKHLVGSTVKGAAGLDADHKLLHQALGHLGGLPHFCYLKTYPFSVIIDIHNQSATYVLERMITMKAPSKEQLLQDVLSDASWKEIADK